MALHSSVLAWRIPGTGEPVGLQPMGSHRVRHDRSDLAAAAAQCEELPWWLLQCRRLVFDPRVSKIPWRRQWQCTPVFLPGKSHGQRSLVGYSPWGCKRDGHDWGTTQQQQHNIHLKGMILCKIFFLTFFHHALYLEYIFLLSQYWLLFLMTAWCLIIRMYFFY